MSRQFVLYGWHLSYFTGKARCYLRYKQIPYVEKPIDFYTLNWRAKKKVNAVVMPIVVTPEREWIADTSVIIDRLEQRFPQRPVVPTTPRQRFAAYLLELWCDEWWVPSAMHTRWSYPENYALFEREAGDHLLPHFPRFLKNRAAAVAANAMRRYQQTVGFGPEQHALLNRWNEDMLDHLDRHFARLPFLLGHKPSLADFALAGPLYGHLGRDPWPKKHLVGPRAHLRSWLERITHPESAAGEWLPGDQLPESLTPVFRAIAAEFLPMIGGILAETKQYLSARPASGRIPRGLGMIEFPMGAGRFRRAALPYTLWMTQRMLDVYRAMPAGEQAAVRGWLNENGGGGLLRLDIPRLKLVGLRVAPEANAPLAQVPVHA